MATVPFRRIVTGHDKAGRSVILEDRPPPRVFDNLGEKGLVFYELWNTQKTPVQIDATSGEPDEGRLLLAPPRSGTRIRIVDIPVFNPQTADLGAVFDNLGAKEAHKGGASDAKHTTFHRTESIDYGIVLDGEVTLMLDEGETTLRAGDVCIQRGTNHGWLNQGTKPCRIAFILIDGAFEPELKK